jgi:2-methylcitrate dehydratase
MSTISRIWAEFAAGLKFSAISDEAINCAKRFLLDSIGCAIGGSHHEDINIMRETLDDLGGTPQATIYGESKKTDVVSATLLNALKVRVMDYNDIYWVQDPSHPSDLIPVASSVGEFEKKSGQEILAAIVLAYELEMRLCEFAVPGIRERGWHHATLTQLASPVVASYMLGNTVDQTVNAIGINGSHNATLGAVAAGKLTMMKNTVDPMASATGVFAALMAKRGYIGTEAIFEGKEGICQQMGEGYDMGKLTDGLGDSWRITQCAFKAFPTEALTHSHITATLALVKEHDIKPEAVQSVLVKTIARAADILADETKYHPETKETADHSLPYVVSAAILDRQITPLQFTQEKIHDPKLRELLPKIKVVADPELEKIFPEKKPSIVEITTTDGNTVTTSVDFPKGDPRNTMTNEELEEKFEALTAEAYPPEQQAAVKKEIWNFAEAPSIDGLLEKMVITQPSWSFGG